MLTISTKNLKPREIISRLMFLCSLFLTVILLRFPVFRSASSDGQEINQTVAANRTTLRASIVLDPPWANLKDDASNYVGNDRYEGLCIDILRAVSEECNFNYVIAPAKDNIYGTADSDGNWNGMVGEILRNETDITGSNLDVTKSRAAVIDFSVAYTSLGLGILIKKTFKANRFFAFMSPFTPHLWVSIFMTGLIFSLAIWFTVALLQNFLIDNHKSSDHGTLLQALWYIFSALLCQGTGSYPHGLGARFLTTVWWFFAFIIASSYTANLAAFLTNEIKVTEINSFEELARQTKIQYGVIGGSSSVLFFQAVNFEPYKRMWKYMQFTQPSPIVANISEGVARVKAGNYALIASRLTVDYYVGSDCELAAVGHEIRQIGSGIGMRKDLPEKDCINGALLTLIENTQMTAFKEKWHYPATSSCNNDNISNHDSPLNIMDLAGVFIVGFAGLFVALVIAFLEKLFQKCLVPQNAEQEQIAGQSISARCCLTTTKEATAPLGQAAQ